MTEVLIPATWLAVALLVLALVVYLSAVLIALLQAGRHLSRLQSHLGRALTDTEPLGNRLETINGALQQLGTGLGAVDRQLAGIVGLFKS